MFKVKPLPDANLLRDLLAYNRKTGRLVWKPRRPEHFTTTEKRSPEWLCRWWNKRFAGTEAGTLDPHGYRIIRVNSIDYRAHRLAWAIVYGTDPDFIDHDNGNTDDNRLNNLKSVPFAANAKNAKRRTDNQSGITGVSWFAPKGTWRVRINQHGKTILLGYFRNLREAIAARKAAEKVHAYHRNHGR